jgi:hypothetical protein
VYLPRFPFLIFVSLSLLKQLAKGYVLRGQGHSDPDGGERGDYSDWELTTLPGPQKRWTGGTLSGFSRVFWWRDIADG